MKKLTAVLLSVLLLASSLPMSTMAAETSEVSETVAADIVATETDTTDGVTQPIENTTSAEKPAADEKPTEATTTVLPAKTMEPVGAKVAEPPVGKSSFTYSVSNNQVTITGLSDEYLTDLVIPDTIEDLPVTAIKENAFSGCSQITSITVPNSVISIGSGAFQGTNPTKVTLPFIGYTRTANMKSGVFGYVFGYINTKNAPAGSIYQYPDASSSSYSYYYYVPKTIKEVTITDDTRVPENAFYNCTWIETIKVNQTIKSIGNNAFYYCSSLTNFEIPDVVGTIGNSAFYYCSSLTNFEIPDTVEEIGDSAFCNCYALRNVRISDSISILNANVFSGCKSLETFNFPANLTQIGMSAFRGCASLNKVDLVIPDGVTSIGSDAFNGCGTITSITVPNSVTSIGNGAFQGTNPTKVTLPFIGYTRTANMKSGVFGYVFGYINTKNAPAGSIYQYPDASSSSYGYYYYLPKTIKEVTITDDTRVPENAFYNCTWIETIKVNQTIKSIGNNAFYYCSSLTNFEIPDVVGTIGNSAFYYCSSLTNIEISDTVEEIGDSAFCNCYALRNVRISDSISILNANVFSGCKSLETFNFPANLTQIGMSAFRGCASLNKVDLVIPDGVTSIGSDAFNGCGTITSITVPNSVTSIGNGAFQGTNPTKVTLPFIGYTRTANMKSGVFGYVFGYINTKNAPAGSIYQYPDASSSSYSYYYYVPKTIKEVTVTDDTRVPENAFYNCTWIETIKVNQTIKSIGNNAFYYCSSLTNFEIPDVVGTIGNSAFYYCSSLTNIEISDTVEEIGDSAFCNCYALRNVRISDSISILNANVFSGCKSLETFNFPANLTQIGMSAFRGCASLNKVDLVIPDGVTSIGSDAFNGCGTITSITVPNSVTSIGNGAFQGTNPTKVTLPFIGYTRTANMKSGVFGYVFGYINTKNAPAGSIYQYPDASSSSYSYYYYVPKTIKEVTITDDTRVPSNAFYNCNWIEKVHINDIEGDASKVGTDAFYNCKAMTVYINRDTAVHTYCERNGIRHCSTKSISLDSDTLVLFRNESKTIGSEVILLNGKVDTEPETVWTSSNPEVASVDRYTGVITAVAPGTATITADSEGVTATAAVTVYFKLEGITLDKATTEIDIHKTETLTVIYNPDNTTDSREITWESSDETIASVDSEGTVTANKVGTATITATASNGKKAECVVDVLVPVKSIAFEQSSYTVPRSQKQKLNLIINPKDTTDTYTLTSSDTTVAMIDKYGNLTARKVGTAIITAETNRGLKATCEVTVNSPATSVQLSSRELTLFVGKEATLTATLAPGDVTDSVQWKSSNSKVATVTNDGKVTAKEAGKATITATANSGVYDTCEVIVVSDMNKTEATLDCITIEYDTTPQTPSVSVYFNDVLLVQDVDYRVEYNNNIDAGEATVTIISLSDGTFIERTFTITAADISKCKIVSKADMEYTGNPLECVEEITFNEVPLVKNVDYTVSYSNNTDTGTAGYEIICKGNYKGSVTGTFTIAPKSVAGLDATVNTGTFTYDGTEKTPGVTVKDGAKTLKENKDYTLSYSKNVNAGTANVTIIGKGNYTGRISREFTIRKKSVNNLLVSLDESEFVYDGKTHSPSVTVKYDNITLRKGVDYEVSYDSNINAGTSTVIVTGKGNYDGEQSIQYSILSKSIENVSITVEPDVFDYDGTEKQPAVTVYDGGNLLNVNVDYVISYEKNRDVGTAKVIVRGIGNYDKSAEAFFDIRYMIGDVNGDGSVTISDVTEIQNYLAEIVDFTDMQLTVADTNGDGKVDIADASHLQLYLAEYDVVLGKS